MRPEFGSRVQDFVFRGPDDEMVTELSVEVRRALDRWEPRVVVHDVNVTVDQWDASLVYIDVSYSPVTTNDRRNLVFPFYTIPEHPPED
jgi:phage baseplate assembly protein W